MSFFICSNCGYGSFSWMGRCPECGFWNSFKEKKDDLQEKREESTIELKTVSLDKIESNSLKRLPTNIYEIDRVLGGGLVEGEVVLLTGEPGVGKSTLILQAVKGLKTLYVAGEEALSQIKNRIIRLNLKMTNFLITEDLQIEGIIEGVKKIKDKIQVLIIDSLQTVYSKKIDSPAGTINQLKEVTYQLIHLAKTEKIIVLLIGHVTKEGEIAGPKTLEHMVDCVLNFEGEKLSHFRLLRSTKNRFGPTDETGIFEMKEQGLEEVKNPLAFIEEKNQSVAGKSIVGVIEGKRPIFFEIQTLVTPSQLAFPRRVVSGYDYNKILLLLAISKKYLLLPIEKYDVYINIIGGVNIRSTAADLGLIASLISSFKNQPLPKNSVFIGEVSLLGEVRSVYFEEKIVKEARRLGFKNIYSNSNLSNIKSLKTILT
jgi:DNA repair protein RadA/Sms